MGIILYFFFLTTFLLLILLFPIVSVIRSSKVSGWKKTGWLFLTLLFSWPAYIVFLILNR